MDSISSFFSRASVVSTIEPKVSITFKEIPEREDYFRVFPNEILKMIFKHISGQMRLETLPKVNYQFHLVSLEFSGKCYHLHHLIPLAANSLEFPYVNDERCVHVLHFKKDLKLSAYNMKFDAKESSITELKSYVTALKIENVDIFDVLTFHSNLWRLLLQKGPADCYKIQHHLLSNQHSNHANHYMYPAMLTETENDCIAVFYNYLLQEETLEEFAEFLIYHGQKLLLNYFIEDDFVQDFISLLEEIHAEAYLILEKKANYDLFKEFRNDILVYAQLSFEKCVEKLKRYLKTKFRAFNSKCSYKNSLIFVSESVWAEEKKFFFNSKNSTYISQIFLHQINPSPELTEEHQWFADKLISLIKE